MAFFLFGTLGVFPQARPAISISAVGTQLNALGI
jgi:hypothetical protein